jgi:hypothetical protein
MSKTPLLFLPIFLLGQQKRSFRGLINSCSCLLLVRWVVAWQPSGFILSHSEPKGTSTLPFPSCFLYFRKFPASRLHGLPLFGLFDPEDGMIYSSERRLTVNGLYGVLTENIVFFVTTAVKNSYPTHFTTSVWITFPYENGKLNMVTARSILLWRIRLSFHMCFVRLHEINIFLNCCTKHLLGMQCHST